MTKRKRHNKTTGINTIKRSLESSPTLNKTFLPPHQPDKHSQSRDVSICCYNSGVIFYEWVTALPIKRDSPAPCCLGLSGRTSCFMEDPTHSPCVHLFLWTQSFTELKCTIFLRVWTGTACYELCFGIALCRTISILIIYFVDEILWIPTHSLSCRPGQITVIWLALLELYCINTDTPESIGSTAESVFD